MLVLKCNIIETFKVTRKILIYRLYVMSLMFMSLMLTILITSDNCLIVWNDTKLYCVEYHTKLPNMHYYIL